MPYEITTPSGVSVTKTLTEEEATKLKADSYFKLTPNYPEKQDSSLDDFFADMKPALRVHRAPLEECESCSA